MAIHERDQGVDGGRSRGSYLNGVSTKCFDMLCQPYNLYRDEGHNHRRATIIISTGSRLPRQRCQGFATTKHRKACLHRLVWQRVQPHSPISPIFGPKYNMMICPIAWQDMTPNRERLEIYLEGQPDKESIFARVLISIQTVPCPREEKQQPFVHSLAPPITSSHFPVSCAHPKPPPPPMSLDTIFFA